VANGDVASAVSSDLKTGVNAIALAGRAKILARKPVGCVPISASKKVVESRSELTVFHKDVTNGDVTSSQFQEIVAIRMRSPLWCGVSESFQGR
jgi:hypothetical protein